MKNGIRILKARVTFEFEYEADVKYYGTTSIKRIIEIDKEDIRNYPMGFEDFFSSKTVKEVHIEEV